MANLHDPQGSPNDTPRQPIFLKKTIQNGSSNASQSHLVEDDEEVGPGSYEIRAEFGNKKIVSSTRNSPSHSFRRGEWNEKQAVGKGLDAKGRESPSHSIYSPRFGSILKSSGQISISNSKLTRLDHFKKLEPVSPGPAYLPQIPQLSGGKISKGPRNTSQMFIQNRSPSPLQYSPEKVTLHKNRGKQPVMSKNYQQSLTKVYSTNTERFQRGNCSPGPIYNYEFQATQGRRIPSSHHLDFASNFHIDKNNLPGVGQYSPNSPKIRREYSIPKSKRVINVRSCNFYIVHASKELYR